VDEVMVSGEQAHEVDEVGIDEAGVDEEGAEEEESKDGRHPDHNERAETPYRPASVHLSCKEFEQMTSAMQAVFEHMETVNRILLRHTTSRRIPLQPPTSQLSFPAEFATLDDDKPDDIEDEGGARPLAPKRRKVSGMSRNWTADEQHRLANFKQRGWTVERISRELGRTASAAVPAEMMSYASASKEHRSLGGDYVRHGEQTLIPCFCAACRQLTDLSDPS
jgi:hypothetical protein